MSLLHPRYGALPQDFPVFPLAGALLLPHGKLPLNIFEPRYLAMVEDALAGQRMFGMIQPDGHQPPGETGPAMFGVGCLGRLSSFSETDDDRFLISLTGLIRFDVKTELPLRRGYRRVVADFAPYEQDLEPPASALPQRAALVEALRTYFTVNGFDANWEAIEGMADDELGRHPLHDLPVRPGGKTGPARSGRPQRRARHAADAAENGRAWRPGPRHRRARVQLNPSSPEAPLSDPEPTQIDPRLLEILVCPVTKGPLVYDRAAGELISQAAGLAYPVRDGIPIMLPDEARPLAVTAAPTEIRVRRATRRLEVDFADGQRFSYPAEYLRVESPSAEVQGHSPDQRVLVAGKQDVGISTVEPVGHYAIRILFDDGHETGIYTWDNLLTPRAGAGTALAGLSGGPGGEWPQP